MISNGSIKVFLADDSQQIRDRVNALLGAAHMDVIGQAATPDTCIAGILDSHPDVVVLDVQLPDISGFDVCAALEGRNGPPPDIILVSSRDVSDYGELVARSCACGFVAKAELSGDLVTALLP